MEKVSVNKVRECLTGVSYPADKQQLISHVRSTCGDENVVSMLKDLPDKSYDKSQILVTELRSILPGISIDIL